MGRALSLYATTFLFAMIWWYDDAGCFWGIFPPVHMSFKRAEDFIRQFGEDEKAEGRHPIIKPDWEITPFNGVEWQKRTSCAADADTSM